MGVCVTLTHCDGVKVDSKDCVSSVVEEDVGEGRRDCEDGAEGDNPSDGDPGKDGVAGEGERET